MKTKNKLTCITWQTSPHAWNWRWSEWEGERDQWMGFQLERDARINAKAVTAWWQANDFFFQCTNYVIHFDLMCYHIHSHQQDSTATDNRKEKWREERHASTKSDVYRIYAIHICMFARWTFYNRLKKRMLLASLWTSSELHINYVCHVQLKFITWHRHSTNIQASISQIQRKSIFKLKHHYHLFYSFRISIPITHTNTIYSQSKAEFSHFIRSFSNLIFGSDWK